MKRLLILLVLLLATTAWADQPGSGSTFGDADIVHPFYVDPSFYDGKKPLWLTPEEMERALKCVWPLEIDTPQWAIVDSIDVAACWQTYNKDKKMTLVKFTDTKGNPVYIDPVTVRVIHIVSNGTAIDMVLGDDHSPSISRSMQLVVKESPGEVEGRLNDR